MFTKILAPIDLAETTLTGRTVGAAAELARAFDSQLRIMNVQSLTPVAFIDYVPEDFDEQIRRGLEQELGDIANGVDLPRERVSTRIVFGPVYPKTLEEAKDWGADVIVVGSHNPGFERLLIGSNAEAIVAHARCSIFVVRG